MATIDGKLVSDPTKDGVCPTRQDIELRIAVA